MEQMMNFEAAWTARREAQAKVESLSHDWWNVNEDQRDGITVELEAARAYADSLPAVYRVADSNLDQFNKGLAKIETQCKRIEKRLGKVIARPEVTYGPQVFVTSTGEGGTSKVTRYTFVLVTGERPEAGGWSFVATLEHLDGGNLIRTVPGVEVDLGAYHVGEPKCDHCGYIRARKDTYIVRHEDGSLKQIGSACLTDYTGGLDPRQCAARAEWHLMLDDAAGDDEDREQSGARVERWINRADALATAVAVVEKFGWVSSQNEYKAPTKGRIEDQFFPPRVKADVLAEIMVTVTDEHKATAEAIVAWVESKEPVSDFDHNLALIVSQEYITPRHFGILAYMPEGYNRHLGKEAERKVRTETMGSSVHVGAVKDKIEVEASIVGVDRFIDSQWGGSYLQSFLTTDGNVLKWFASNPLDLTVGTKVHLRGTVKGHGSFNGIDETTVTRCKVTEV